MENIIENIIENIEETFIAIGILYILSYIIGVYIRRKEIPGIKKISGILTYTQITLMYTSTNTALIAIIFIFVIMFTDVKNMTTDSKILYVYITIGALLFAFLLGILFAFLEYFFGKKFFQFTLNETQDIQENLPHLNKNRLSQDKDSFNKNDNYIAPYNPDQTDDDNDKIRDFYDDYSIYNSNQGDSNNNRTGDIHEEKIENCEKNDDNKDDCQKNPNNDQKDNNDIRDVCDSSGSDDGGSDGGGD